MWKTEIHAAVKRAPIALAKRLSERGQFGGVYCGMPKAISLGL
jgi:hypothetical protein